MRRLEKVERRFEKVRESLRKYGIREKHLFLVHRSASWYTLVDATRFQYPVLGIKRLHEYCHGHSLGSLLVIPRNY